MQAIATTALLGTSLSLQLRTGIDFDESAIRSSRFSDYGSHQIGCIARALEKVLEKAEMDHTEADDLEAHVLQKFIVGGTIGDRLDELEKMASSNGTSDEIIVAWEREAV